MSFATQSFARHPFASVKQIILYSIGFILVACNQETPPPLQYKEAHLEFVDFIKTITIAESECKNEGEFYCVPSMRIGAEPWSKIHWQTAYTEEIPDSKDPMGKFGTGRKGEVYLSIEGKPTNLDLDTVLKPSPWSLTVIGPTSKMVYHVFLAASIFVEDYVDLGEYLINKGLAKHIEVSPQDTSEGTCTTNWYKIKLKDRNPIWMGIMRDGGNAFGIQRIRFDYEKPTENEFWCKKMEENIPLTDISIENTIRPRKYTIHVLNT